MENKDLLVGTQFVPKRKTYHSNLTRVEFLPLKIAKRCKSALILNKKCKICAQCDVRGEETTLKR